MDQALASTLLEKTESVVNHIGNAEESLRQLSTASDKVYEGISGAGTATQELSSSIEEIARQAQKSQDLVTEAVEDAVKAKSSSRSLEEAAKKIEKVLELIQTIAAQTNLLALNATIEAARAGDAGRGFAVVASEVKALATQTAKATEEIAEQISQIQSTTETTVNGIDRISNRINTVQSTAVAIASAVQQQTAAAREISMRIQQAADGSKDFGGAAQAIHAGASADRDRVAEIDEIARRLLAGTV